MSQQTIDSLEIKPDGSKFNKLARGRNGIFKPRYITFAATLKVVRFELLSRRAGRMAPIWFEMSPDEARLMIKKLNAVLPPK